MRAFVLFCQQMNDDEDQEGELWVTSVNGTTCGTAESCWLPLCHWQIVWVPKLLKTALEYLITRNQSFSANLSTHLLEAQLDKLTSIVWEFLHAYMPENAKCRVILWVNVLRFSPPILALKATPTPHTPLFAAAATSPAHRVPCLPKHKRKWSQIQKAASE